jgi:hypothetical protein
MRRLAFGILIAVALVGAAGAQTDEVVLPDGRFASMTDYLAGTWAWEREAPRQTRHMRFSRNGDFLYQNLTLGLIYHGRYEVKPGALRIIIHRTCDIPSSGQTCGERTPSLDRSMSLHPVGAHAFDSQAERWNRIRRE